MRSHLRMKKSIEKKERKQASHKTAYNIRKYHLERYKRTEIQSKKIFFDEQLPQAMHCPREAKQVKSCSCFLKSTQFRKKYPLSDG